MTNEKMTNEEKADALIEAVEKLRESCLMILNLMQLLDGRITDLHKRIALLEDANKVRS